MKKIILILVIIFTLLCAVSVAEEKPTIAFDAESYSIPLGKNVNIKTIIAPKSNLKLEWSSSNEKVATVDANGLVKGVGPGKTKITVKTGKTGSINGSPEPM